MTEFATIPKDTPAPKTEGEYGVPQSLSERKRIRAAVREYVGEKNLVPPLAMKEIVFHTGRICRKFGIPELFGEFTSVWVGNEAWRSTVARIPFDRRILLLPQCLKSQDYCAAEHDAFGLLCEECGNCPIGSLQALAESLGYVVLVAEGNTVVGQLLSQGKVDAVIGVSCLEALKRSFPYMIENAIPGFAVPLTRDGCKNTEIDEESVRTAIVLKSPERKFRRIDLRSLLDEVRSWFSPEFLASADVFGQSRSEEIALEWVSRAGKRWRPFLAVAASMALHRHGNHSQAEITDELKTIALAIECFHKASLIHDDIEDGDDTRYGEKTVHYRHGIPMAINIGDLLLGEGYRLLAECNLTSPTKNAMLTAAAQGHRDLCLGQGMELTWRDDRSPIRVEDMLEMFRLKTSPAFEVALRIGAVYGGADAETELALREYSRALGIAYQVRDDVQDFPAEEAEWNQDDTHLSLLMALLYEKTTGKEQEFLEKLWKTDTITPEENSRLMDLLKKMSIHEEARELLEKYRARAVEACVPLQNIHLKRLLIKTLATILGPMPRDREDTAAHGS